MKRRSFVAWCLGAVPFLKGLVNSGCGCDEEPVITEISVGPVPEGGYWQCPMTNVTVVDTAQGPHGWVTQEVGRVKAIMVSPGEYQIELDGKQLRFPAGTKIEIQRKSSSVKTISSRMS